MSKKENEAIKHLDNPALFLLQTGLLFEINRAILHPLGLTIEIERCVETSEIRIGGIIDCRDDPEGIIYAPEAFAEGQEKYQAFMSVFGKGKHCERIEKIGYLVQNEHA